jgi:tetratricopeptide (TPR) repeat protein
VNYNLARVLEALGRTDEAVRYYTAARSIRPETAHELAHALEHRGESDEAIEVFRQLCLIRARNGRHLSCFGRALQARGRVEESGKILDSAIAALREEIQLHPDHFSARSREIRLFSEAWTNPHPDKMVTTIDVVSKKTACAPFLVALTLETKRK